MGDVGRPTKYTEEINQQMIDYFSIVPYYWEDVTRFNKETGEEEVIRQKKIINDLPLISGFCCKIGVSRDTLHRWATETNEDGTLKHSEFSDTYKRAKEYQERILVTNGLQGNYNNSFSIFTAKNVIGWRDKTEIEANVNGEFNLFTSKLKDKEKILNERPKRRDKTKNGKKPS